MWNETYEQWLKLTEGDEALHGELTAIRGNEKEIVERFYRELEFGTAGLRGILGAGTNRMNFFTVGRAASGVAEYLNTHFEKPAVAIGFDSRHMSEAFARRSAEIYAANGIKVYLFDSLKPTPMVSYAVRTLGCQGGVMVTASHNPKQYNGYKVYGPDGCQIGQEVAEEVERFIRSTPYEHIRRADFDAAVQDGRIVWMPPEIEEGFLREVQKYSLSDGSIDLKIVYTPLNGTGNRPVREILRRIGAKNVFVVPEQENPDPDFTTCPYPNPEIRQALECAIRMADEVKADLMLATDPDADRVGVAVRHRGEIVLLTGNETGILLTNYLLERRRKEGTLPKRPFLIKTIVTTNMPDAIMKDYGGEVYDTYTGFKYIGDLYERLRKEGREGDYLLGFEESYGYMPGGYVRDKDAVGASMLIAEMADYYDREKKDLVDVLEALYAKYGCYQSKTVSFEFKGKEGADKMAEILGRLRARPPKELAGDAVLEVRDYLKGVPGYEPANVISYECASLRAIVRPSGTEPKIKVYVHTKGADQAACRAVIDRALEYFGKAFE